MSPRPSSRSLSPTHPWSCFYLSPHPVSPFPVAGLQTPSYAINMDNPLYNVLCHFLIKLLLFFSQIILILPIGTLLAPPFSNKRTGKDS